MRLARLRGHSRKLSDVYIDAKLPRALRRSARVLVRISDQTIVWAEHVGVAFGERAEDLPLPARTVRTF
jgi:tRNA(Ile)-lysidine synthetase-like protein